MKELIGMTDDTPETDALDPEEFLRRMLAISPEDAAEVRAAAAERGGHKDQTRASEAPEKP